MLAADRPDGLILATPNRMHVEGGLACVAEGLPVIVEKPIGDTVEGATRLVEAGESAGVPVLTGHHRNYSPIMAKAREIVRSGRLGSLVAITGSALFHKPDDYFDVGGGWRREPGGGPILLNLIHDVNGLMALGGDIVAVQATTSDRDQGFPGGGHRGDDLPVRGGALGTFLLSDSAASARSWEQTSRENSSYASYPDEDCYHLAGTTGSLSVPTMRMRVFPANGPGSGRSTAPSRTPTAAIRSPTRWRTSRQSSMARPIRSAAAATASTPYGWSMPWCGPPEPAQSCRPDFDPHPGEG